MLGHFVTFLVDLIVGTRRGDHEKELQILVLRQQVRLLQRQRPCPPRLTRAERLTLAVFTAALARLTAGTRDRLDQSLLLFKPDTILKGSVALCWGTPRGRAMEQHPSAAAWCLYSRVTEISHLPPFFALLCP